MILPTLSLAADDTDLFVVGYLDGGDRAVAYNPKTDGSLRISMSQGGPDLMRRVVSHYFTAGWEVANIDCKDQTEGRSQLFHLRQSMTSRNPDNPMVVVIEDLTSLTYAHPYSTGTGEHTPSGANNAQLVEQLTLGRKYGVAVVSSQWPRAGFVATRDVKPGRVYITGSPDRCFWNDSGRTHGPFEAAV